MIKPFQLDRSKKRLKKFNKSWFMHEDDNFDEVVIFTTKTHTNGKNEDKIQLSDWYIVEHTEKKNVRRSIISYFKAFFIRYTPRHQVEL